MIHVAITPKDRRTLLIGGLVVGGLLLLGLGLPRYRAWRAGVMEDARSATAELRRAERSVAQYGATTSMLARSRGQRAVLDSLLLDGGTITAAGTALSGAVAESAEIGGVILGSVLVRPDSLPRTALTHLTARATATGDAASIARFLSVLETAPPHLVVREWSISGGSAAPLGGQAEVLRVDLLVEGVWVASR